jgi:hypothetical protein
MAWPEPVTWSGGGGRSMGWGGAGGSAAGMSAQLGQIIEALGQVHQAVRMVAPGTARGVDRSLSGMSARVAGRFS